MVPTEPSKYPWPPDTQFAISGNATCALPHSISDFCNSFQHDCDPPNTPVKMLHHGPSPLCSNPFILIDNYQYNQLRLVGTAAWEFVGYAEVACEEKVITISPEQAEQCFSKSELIKGLTWRPLFNGDLN